MWETKIALSFDGWHYLAPFEQLGPGVLESDTKTDLVSQYTVQRFSD